jgi:hypothetical protein
MHHVIFSGSHLGYYPRLVFINLFVADEVLERDGTAARKLLELSIKFLKAGYCYQVLDHHSLYFSSSAMRPLCCMCALTPFQVFRQKSKARRCRSGVKKKVFKSNVVDTMAQSQGKNPYSMHVSKVTA